MKRPLIARVAFGAALLTTVGCGSNSDKPDASTGSDIATTTVVISTTSTVSSAGTDTTGPVTTPVTVAASPGTTTAATSTTAPPRVVTSPSDSVRLGDTGPGVEQIQASLKAAGYDLQPDGIFGPVTDTAVRDFQQKNNLAVDGVVGPKTWAKLGQASDASSTTTVAT